MRETAVALLVTIAIGFVLAVPVAACDTSPGPGVLSITLVPESVTRQLPDENTATFTVTVTTQCGDPVKNALVMFSTDNSPFQTGGQITGIRTDANGRGSVTLVSTGPGKSTLVGWIDVNGNYVLDRGESSATSTVTWLPPVLKISSITLVPESVTRQLPDENTQGFTATLLDQNNQPPKGALVMFSLDNSRFLINGQPGGQVTGVRTDANGQAAITVVSTGAGKATLTAWADLNQNYILDCGEPADTSTITWLPPVLKITSITLLPVSATRQLPDETTQSFTATLLDQNNQPPKGALVMFSTDFGAFQIAGQPDGKITGVRTDANGQAAVTLVSTTPGTATLTAWADLNQNYKPDCGEPSVTSTVTWLPVAPPPFSCPAEALPLVASDGKTVGCLVVSNLNEEGTNTLTAAFTAADGLYLSRADLAIGITPSDIPSVNGVPAPDLFPFKQTFDPSSRTTAATINVDITPYGDVAVLLLSAHIQTTTGQDGWVLSLDNQGNQVMYFPYIVQ
ncbi:MAG TPA: Ig-like domain-containing protein [Methanomicrobiales archaeon]|nr:Ig-like domain-containing protein [Methanomicrobiales archaeon]